MTCPICHSVIDAPSLARELERRYDLGGAIGCHLLYRGMNDIFTA